MHAMYDDLYVLGIAVTMVSSGETASWLAQIPQIPLKGVPFLTVLGRAPPPSRSESEHAASIQSLAKVTEGMVRNHPFRDLGSGLNAGYNLTTSPARALVARQRSIGRVYSSGRCRGTIGGGL